MIYYVGKVSQRGGRDRVRHRAAQAVRPPTMHAFSVVAAWTLAPLRRHGPLRCQWCDSVSSEQRFKGRPSLPESSPHVTSASVLRSRRSRLPPLTGNLFREREREREIGARSPARPNTNAHPPPICRRCGDTLNRDRKNGPRIAHRSRGSAPPRLPRPRVRAAVGQFTLGQNI